ncbi:MAG: hypothetical protein ACOC2L_01485 [Candidatus Sumerlaeota bacterium]
MRRNSSVIMLALCLLILASAAQAQQTYVWWEGEDYQSTNAVEPLEDVPGHQNPEQRSKLSGGKWMTPHEAKGGGAVTITYHVEVPETKTYDLWVRKFWKHGPFKWRFNDGDWQEVTKRITLQDNTFIAQHWGANWVFIDKVDLEKGNNVLHVEMMENKGCFDAWLLIDGPFNPRGKMKPGEKTGDAMAGYFPWEPSVDTFEDDCPIDMSFLNKPIKGFVKRQGNGFVDVDGEPVRFWMVQAGDLVTMDHETTDFWARRLSKYGVNLVRIQFSDMFKAYANKDMESFNKILDDIHYLAASLKKQGIYLYFGHLYWQTHVTVDESVAGPGYGKGKTPLEHLFFDQGFQNWYKQYVDAVMNSKNPYTGMPMSKDPVVAFVEIQNESSLFFHTFKPDNFVTETLRQIEKAFGDWAAKKYGSVDAALSEWGPDKNPERWSKQSRDVADEGRLALYDVQRLGGAQWAVNQRNTKRASDQLQFMAEWQKKFYEEMVQAFHKEIGMENMVACSNWKTADPKVLDVFERYTYTPGDVICRNVYFGVDYKTRPKRGYAIDLGDTFKHGSALLPPKKPAPLTVAHVNDHPYMITENNWTRPNRFRAEWPFLIATYAQMMGVDGWNFFSLNSSQWQTPMTVWELNSPCILGQFPAAALIFRKGYVQEADYAVEEKLNFQDLYNFKGSWLYELGGQDAIWVARLGELESGADASSQQPEPLAFFVGKINRIPTDEPSSLKTVDFSKYIDPTNQKVKSMTDELQWDYGKGIVTVSTPHAQGATGFLSKENSIDLGDIQIDCDNEYASILVVSLDGQPLKESKKILLQAATEDLPYGFETKSSGEYHEITNLGGHPLNVKKIDAKVTFKNAGVKATVLDGNGYKTERMAETSGGQVTLPEDSIYTLITRP